MKSMAKKLGVAITAMILVAATVSYGLPIIEIQDGSTENPFNGWAGNIEARPGGGAMNADNYNIDTDISGEDSVNVDNNAGAGLEEDAFWTTGNSLAGNIDYSVGTGIGVASVGFDFYADVTGADNHPSRLQLYLEGNDGEAWYYTIDNSLIEDGWNHYYVGVLSQGDWYNMTGASWNDLITDVDRIGFTIQYVSGRNQVYGFDDVGLHSPEPGTYMVLGVALISMAIVFRKKIKESLTQARSLVNA